MYWLTDCVKDGAVGKALVRVEPEDQVDRMELEKVKHEWSLINIINAKLLNMYIPEAITL